MEILSLGLNKYNGKNISLPDISIEEERRKTRVIFILKALILQYVVSCTNEENIHKMDNKNYEDLIIKCMNICIEFCIEINEMDYL